MLALEARAFARVRSPVSLRTAFKGGALTSAGTFGAAAGISEGVHFDLCGTKPSSTMAVTLRCGPGNNSG